MTPTLIAVDGMVHRTTPLTIDRLLDCATVDTDDRVLVAMIDVLMMMRLDVGAEVVLVEHRNGTTSALCVHEVIAGGNVHLQLLVRLGCVDERSEIVPRIWMTGATASAEVAALRAITFSSFVGQR